MPNKDGGRDWKSASTAQKTLRTLSLSRMEGGDTGKMSMGVPGSFR